MSRRQHGYLHDEQGDRSFARLCLSVVTVNILALVWVDVLTTLDVPATAYALLGTMFTFLCIWAMGRAAMRYLGPQVGAVVAALSRPNEPHRWASGDQDAGIA